jgi:DNA-binding transcriptional LysR family regulator
MTLKQLEAFYWAAALGNFATAADRLCVTQSSLSKRIAELESDLGKQLFNRSGYRSVLTEQGEELIEYARRMLELEGEIRGKLSARRSLRGVCRFGISELGSLTWLPKLVTRVRLEYPEVVLEPHVDLAFSLERRVGQGELDFAIVAAASTDPAIASQVLSEVKVAWIASPSLIKDGTLLTPERIYEHPIITMTADSGLAREFTSWATSHGLQTQRILACNNFSAIIGLTVAGIGISFLPKEYLAPLAISKQIVQLESEPALPNLKYFLQSRSDDSRYITKAIKQLVMEEVDFTIQHGFGTSRPYGEKVH